MKIRYDNEQDDTDPMNGAIIVDCRKLSQLLDDRRNAPPLFIRLSGSNGYEIMVGIGANIGCVQYNRSDGLPPYLVAVPSHSHVTRDVEFFTGNTATPVPARNILSFDEMKEIALHFLKTGERSGLVSWDSI